LRNLPIEDMDGAIKYCLDHELSEAIHGTDIPSHIKDMYNIKDKFETQHNLSESDYRWFKFADVAESWLYCIEHCIESWEEKLTICNDIALRLTKYCDDIEVFKWLDSMMYRKVPNTHNIIGQQMKGAKAFLETGGRFNGNHIALLCCCVHCGTFFVRRKDEFVADKCVSCGCLSNCDTSKLTAHQWEVRFMRKVDINYITGCWDFTGAVDKKGYGIMKGMGENKAHRLSYRIFNGDIKKGMLICHTCDNPSCVNPDHLFQGTVQDNSDDMVNKGRGRGGISPLKGEANPNSKLTEREVITIRTSNEPNYILAEKYNIGRPAISQIKNNKKWKHI